jgi:hypothetical protein
MFDAPRPVSLAAQPGNYIQPNLGHGLRIWWAFYWRTILSSILVATAVNLILRRFPNNSTIALISRYDNYVLYYLVAFFAMAYILRKNFQFFRIALLSNRGGEGAEPLSPTLQRTARVWWAFCWRAVIYRVIVTFAAMLPLGWTMGFLMAVLPGPAIAALVTSAIQVILDGVVGMFVIYSSILDEDISDFRVALLPRTASTSAIGTIVPEG